MSQIIAKVPSAKERDYPIKIAAGLLKTPEAWLPKEYQPLVIITDNTIKSIYAKPLQKKLIQLGYETKLFSFPAGEKSKSQKIKTFIEEKMLAEKCGRNSLILALGGGVVGDMAGFIAATYMRGVPFIQLPSSLLAMIDSSVGGKNGINTTQGKNLIGTFYQPKAVIIDRDILKTLPQKHLINGLIEAIKIFLTNDSASFYFLKKNLDKILSGSNTVLEKIIQQAVSLKANIVEQDEKENHLRMILNFGHTIAHAIEALSNYKVLHGYAVGFGILFEAKISQLLGLLPENSYETIKTVFNNLGIDSKALAKYDINKIISFTKIDKKIKSNEVRYVLLKNIGEFYQAKQQVVHPVTDESVKQAFLELINGR